MNYVIKWKLYINDFDQITVLEGPFPTKQDAEESAIEGIKQINSWHAASWSLSAVQPVGEFPSWVRLDRRER